MTLRTFAAALATTALATLAAPVFAQDKSGTNLDAAGEGTRGATAQLALAYDLYDIGMANSDALTVLTAARLAASVGTSDVEREKETEGEALADEGAVAEAPIDVAGMLASARALAGEDEVLAGLIDDAEAEGTRGRIGGASRTLSRLPAGQTDRWRIPFYGRSLAEVAIVGDGDAPLHALITDENGNTICYDVSRSDKLYCNWVPAWNGNFFVVVENVGRKRNSYYILTN